MQCWVGDSDILRQFHVPWSQTGGQRLGIWHLARIEVSCQQMCQFYFASLFMGDEEQIHHPAAGVASWQIPLQHLPSFSVFGPGKQAVAVD